MCLALGEWHQFGVQRLHKTIHLEPGVRAAATDHDHAGFEIRRRADQAERRRNGLLHEPFRLGLGQQNGDQRGTVDHHQPNRPFSS
jgi:hypothetical protein